MGVNALNLENDASSKETANFIFISRGIFAILRGVFVNALLEYL